MQRKKIVFYLYFVRRLLLLFVLLLVLIILLLSLILYNFFFSVLYIPWTLENVISVFVNIETFAINLISKSQHTHECGCGGLTHKMIATKCLLLFCLLFRSLFFFFLVFLIFDNINKLTILNELTFVCLMPMILCICGNFTHD